MSGHKPWSEISAKIRSDPERRARIEQREQAIEAELTSSQLREARDVTQENIADSTTAFFFSGDTIAMLPDV